MGSLYGNSITRLVDTGASPNVTDRGYFERLVGHNKPALHPVTVDLRAADGSPLRVLGGATVELYIANHVFNVHVFVLPN